MKRITVFLYGVVSYALFFGTFLYAAGFVGNFLVPRTIDAEPQMSFWPALAINLLLLGAFAVQHSVMARPAFKKWLTRFIPKAAERSTYVLLSSLILIALFVHWQPLGGIVWSMDNVIGRGLLYALFAFGWGLVLVATLQINHFDLFGLRQVWLYLRGRKYTPLPFKTPGLYKYIRHPLYVGWFVAFWATPTMTGTHLVFAVVTTAYILFAIRLEEKDLAVAHPEYADYRRQVPMLVPSASKHYASNPPAQPSAA